MGRRKLSSEERHRRQKEKLTSDSALKPTTGYIEKPSLKAMACEKAIEKGYKCVLENSVLMFLCLCSKEI